MPKNITQPAYQSSSPSVNNVYVAKNVDATNAANTVS